MYTFIDYGQIGLENQNSLKGQSSSASNSTRGKRLLYVPVPSFKLHLSFIFLGMHKSFTQIHVVLKSCKMEGLTKALDIML